MSENSEKEDEHTKTLSSVQSFRRIQKKHSLQQLYEIIARCSEDITQGNSGAEAKLAVVRQ